MKSNGIEDIIIESAYKSKKKKNTGLKILIFFMFLILALFVFAYYYFTNLNTTSTKELFVTNISKLNTKEILQSDIYESIIENIEAKDFETNTNATFTTTLKNEELKNVDVSKLELEILNKNDVENSKSFSEAIIKYAENEIFRLNSLSNENSIALFSNEIHDKYVGCGYENIQETLNIDYNYKNIKQLRETEKLSITEEEKNKYIEKYFSKIIENIPEENFGVQENIVIKKADGSVDVTAYTLKLSVEELNKLIKDTLKTLKGDTELLNEFAILNESGNNEENTENEIETETVPEIEIQPEENIETENQIIEETNEDFVNENIEEVDDGNSETNIEIEGVQEENSEEIVQEETPSIPVVTINPVGTISPVEMEESTKNIITEFGKSSAKDDFDITDLLQRLIFGKKLDITVEECQELIEKLENDEFFNSGNKDLLINIYASEENVEKITVEFPNDNSLDLEFTNKSDKENSIKITYLKKENSQMNGFSLDFNKIQNDANTTINTTYNVIENEKINKKIILNLKTNGTVNSKELTNDIVLTISTSKGETKVIIDNTIKFNNVDEIEELTNENCLYLDQLSEEELKTTLNDLETKIKNLYNDKKENLNFINTNTGGITLEDISTTITREEAQNALITRVSNMMQEAIVEEREFTIKDLENLTIDGYEVSSTVTEENAKIVVDTYTFNIDKNFTLTDAE